MVKYFFENTKIIIAYFKNLTCMYINSTCSRTRLEVQKPPCKPHFLGTLVVTSCTSNGFPMSAASAFS